MTLQNTIVRFGAGTLLAALLTVTGSAAWADGHRDRDDDFRGRGRGPGGVGIEFRLGNPAPAVTQRWVEGHYITQTQSVLVEAAHYENRWVAPVTELRYDRHGRSYLLQLRPGCYEQVLVPDRYETRCVQVWVPGYWETVAAPAPACNDGLRLRIGGIIRF
jgi:hypothetical protein